MRTNDKYQALLAAEALREGLRAGLVVDRECLRGLETVDSGAEQLQLRKVARRQTHSCANERITA